MRIPNLPNWCITDKNPAFYDTESASAIKQTAKLHAAIRELQEDYNLFANEVNTKIEQFKTSEEGLRTEFENEINKLVHDYIVTIDTKIAHQDRVIQESIVYIKDNLKQAVTNLLNEMKESGELSEVILNAFNELNSRVESIETSISEHETKITNLENNLNTTNSELNTFKEESNTFNTQLMNALNFTSNTISEIRGEIAEVQENQANFYTKDEMNNVQTATITIPANEDNSGNAIITFKRSGNVVYVNVELICKAGYDFPYWLNKIIDIPNFAKTNTNNTFLINQIMLGDYGKTTEGEPLSIGIIGKAYITKPNDYYMFTGNVVCSTTQTEDYKLHFSGCYIVE